MIEVYMHFCKLLPSDYISEIRDQLKVLGSQAINYHQISINRKFDTLKKWEKQGEVMKIVQNLAQKQQKG